MPRKTIIQNPLFSLCAVIGFAMISAACAPMVATRGNYVEDERLKSIQLNVSSKDEVVQKLGSPTTIDPFDPNRWFYIGEQTETISFYDPDVISRKVMALTFNEDGFLTAVDTVDETAGRDVETVKKTTPAPGREINAFEQFIGNLGKFNQAGAPTSGIPGQ